jgi:Tol biopolymer transport system component
MNYKTLCISALPVVLAACGSLPSAEGPQFGDVTKVEIEEVKDEETGKTTVVAEERTERAEVSVADIGTESLMTVQRYITVGQPFENFAIADDGRITVSQFNREGQDGLDIWIYGPGKMRVTKTSHYNASPSFSRDGSKIYFSSRRGRVQWGDFDQPDYIWRVAALGGGGVTRIGYPAHSYEGTVEESPDGKHILYASRELGGSDSSIWMANAQGNLPTQLAAGHSPGWLDDETIVFVAPDPNTGLDAIWSRSTSGTELTQLAADAEANCLQPAASPDGRYIAYVKESADAPGRRGRNASRDPEESRDIYVYDTHTGLSQQLTTNASRDDLPRWSSDGSSLLFRSTRGLAWNIWRVSTQSVAAM